MKNDDWNIITLVGGTVQFHGFGSIDSAVKICGTGRGVYIKPIDSLPDDVLADASTPGYEYFNLVDNKSRDIGLMNIMWQNRSFCCHFTLLDGVYYQTGISIGVRDL